MIVITTPAGQIGRQVLGSLLQSGEQLRVIARDRSQLPAEEDTARQAESINDMAEIMSQVLGKDVRFQQITLEAYKDRFVRLGTSGANWPPVKGPATAAGVTGTFGTIKRSDGSVQATFDGHPLYAFAGDTAPGQNKGNGLNISGGL